jgi:transcriptional regulator
MYIPKYFSMPDSDVLDFIRANPFGILITAAADGIKATHLPFHVKETKDSWVLWAHLAGANPHASCLLEKEHLAIFSGVHAYISSSWYKNVNVSTWNYEAVHVTGTIQLLTEPELLDALNELTNSYEYSQDSPRTLDKIPTKMVSAYLKEIVGFAFHPQKVEAKTKLSQNRNQQDHASIVSHLEKQVDPLAKEVAKKMRKNRPA